MSHVYADLADALNVLPNGFPRTETGSDLRLLEFMYDERVAELASWNGYCHMTICSKFWIAHKLSMSRTVSAGNRKKHWVRGVMLQN